MDAIRNTGTMAILLKLTQMESSRYFSAVLVKTLFSAILWYFCRELEVIYRACPPCHSLMVTRTSLFLRSSGAALG